MGISTIQFSREVSFIFEIKKLKEITYDDRGNYRFIVSGTEIYTVTASITPEGEL